MSINHFLTNDNESWKKIYVNEITANKFTVSELDVSGNLDIEGNVNIGGNLDVSGNVNMDQNLSVSEDITCDTISADNIQAISSLKIGPLSPSFYANIVPTSYSAVRQISIPDAGGSSNMLLSRGNQSITGNLTIVGNFDVNSANSLTIGKFLSFNNLVTSNISLSSGEVNTTIQFIKEVASLPDNVDTAYLTFTLPNNKYQISVFARACVSTLPDSTECSVAENKWIVTRIANNSATVVAGTASILNSNASVLALTFNGSNVSGAGTDPNTVTLSITSNVAGGQTASSAYFDVTIYTKFIGGGTVLVS